jgi:hypothetical protein
MSITLAGTCKFVGIYIYIKIYTYILFDAVPSLIIFNVPELYYVSYLNTAVREANVVSTSESKLPTL